MTTPTIAEVRSPPTSSVEHMSSTPDGTSARATGTATAVGGTGGVIDGGATTGTATTDVVTTMTFLLQAQAEAMTARAKAVIVQSLLALPCFTGEGSDAAEDGFDKWIRKFRERAKFAGWSAADQLYQLELHLDKTAMDVFHTLLDSELNDIESVIAALGKCFKPSDIEELHGLQFYYLAQGDESIEQLGISIQQLGRKVFPNITGKDFDRLLKGRFYQALQVKWQRKLGAPKPDETFHDLLARVRMLEEHEKQFAASAELCPGSTGRKPTRGEVPKSKEQTNTESSSRRSTGKNGSTSPTKATERRCFFCQGVGHLQRDCPSKKDQKAPSETPGKTRTLTNTSSTGTVLSSTNLEHLTEEELERLLALKKLAREGSLLLSSNNTINALSGEQAGVIALLVEVEVGIAGDCAHFGSFQEAAGCSPASVRQVVS